MNIPILRQGSRSRDILTRFGGLDRRELIDDGAFAAMENLSPRRSPCMSVRERRALIGSFADPIVGLLGKEQLCVVTASAAGLSKFYYAGEEVEEVSSLLLTSSGERSLVSMGANVVIFPDKVMYNTVTGEAKPLEAEITVAGEALENLSLTLCTEDGTSFSGVLESSDAAAEPENGSYWLDISGSSPVLKVWSASEGAYLSVATTFVKIEHPALETADGGALFKQYDTVEISGMDDPQFNTALTVWSAGAGWIVVTGIITSVSPLDGAVADEITRSYTSSGSVTFARRVPELDFVVECDNRLWGCRYGGEINELRACKLGDPTNWECYMGLASDSYAVSLGSDGVFTGAAVHDGTVIFFKENYIHKVFGSKPSNYQTVTVEGRGIRRGCHRSAAIVNEVLYYVSKTGPVAYTGGEPADIGAPLGRERFTDAVGGALNGRYYVCMTGRNGSERSLYSFDPELGQWFREDGADIRLLTSLKSDLIAAGDGELVLLNGESGEPGLDIIAREKPVEWYAETGDIGLMSPDEKYYSFLQLRFEAEAGARIRVEFMFDSDGHWVERYRFTAGQRRAVTLPFVTPRCDHFRIRLSGTGDATMFSLSKYYEAGGDTGNG